MPQQYHNAPNFGTNYQVALSYPPFSTTSPHEVASSTPMLQQSAMQSHHHHIPPPQANDIRFNANMQLPVQGAPFPFPPSINPELFNRFPPPPPPLPLNFNSTPSTPVAFPQFASHAISNLPASAQAPKFQTSEMPTGATHALAAHPFTAHSAYSAGAQYEHASLDNTQLDQHAQTLEPHRAQGTSSYQSSTEMVTHSQDNQEDESQMYDPAKAFRVSENSFLYPRIKSATSKPVLSSSEGVGEQPLAAESSPSGFLHAELKEKAKAAILSLSSHRITYDDLLAEGLDPELLRSLFEELQLDLNIPQQNSPPLENSTQHTNHRKTETGKTSSSAPTNVTQHAPTTTATTAPNANRSTPVQTSTVSAGMERKDRIAQLLAAKAAKGHSVGAMSPSASPASASDLTPRQTINKESGSHAENTSATRTSSQTPIVGDNGFTDSTDARLAQIRSVADNLLQRASDVELSANLSSLIPTPIRESLIENGLSSLIPGLFMLNDDEPKDDPSKNQAFTTDLRDSQRMDDLRFENRSSRKRSSDWMVDSEQSAPKRFTQPELQDLDVTMHAAGSEEGEASEGEIVEELEAVKYSKPSRQNITTQPSITNAYPRTDKVNGRTTSDNLPRSSETKQHIPDTVRNIVPAPSPRPISKLTPAQLAERAAQLKADLLRQRRIRQQQLTDGMPALDEEVIKTQHRIEQSKLKLADVRGQLQKYEAEAIRARESERDLLVEIQRLERQLEEGMNGQKRFSTELKTIESQGSEHTPILERESPNQLNSSRHSALATTSIGGEDPSSQQHDTAAAVHKDQNSTLPEGVLATAQRSSHNSSGNVTPDSSTRSRSAGELNKNSPSETDETDKIGDQISRSQLQSELSNAVNSRNVTSDGDVSFSDKASNTSSRSEDSRMSIDNESDEESEGSASMSDSGSEDYEPVDHENDRLAESHRGDSDEEYEPEETATKLAHMDENIDDYEPSDMLEQTEFRDSGSDRQSNATGDPPVTDNIGPHRQRAGVSEQSTLHISQVDQHPKTDDQEGATQLSEANTLTRIHEIPQSDEGADGMEPGLGTDTGTKPHYVPYQSPLSSFKSYRFHSSFNDKIKSGYRSLTYSNNIDPTRPICPTELSGQVCSDPHCEEQHFESMALTDDKILVQMSSANDITDKALRDQYLIGLKQVIAGLRQNNVKDFSEVADALSSYRRQWAENHLNF